MSEEVKKETEVKKTGWASKIWSAIIGIVVGVAGMFGISQDQIKTEKAKVETMKTSVVEAIYNLEQGDAKAAIVNLKEITATTKEVAADIKAAAEKAKAEKQTVVEKAKDAVVKEVVKQEVKAAEKAIEPKKTETPVVKEEKKEEVKTEEVKKVETPVATEKKEAVTTTTATPQATETPTTK